MSLPPSGVRPGATAVYGAVIACNGTALYLIITMARALDFTVEDGEILETLAPIWRPAALLAGTAIMTAFLLTGRRWARWALVIAGIALAGWILFRADLGTYPLHAALIVAAGWGISGLALAVVPGVGEFVSHQRELALLHTLGPLETETDVERWTAVIETWESGALTSRRERAIADRMLAAFGQKQSFR